MGDPVRHAWAVWYVCTAGVLKGFNKGFACTLTHHDNPVSMSQFPRQIGMLAVRLRDVQLESVCALKLLRRMSDLDDVVVYCDPPYFGSDCSAYSTPALDVDAFLDVLKEQKGCVAVSGYGDVLDGLGWNRYELDVQFWGRGKGSGDLSRRTEVLWANYDGENQLSLF